MRNRLSRILGMAATAAVCLLPLLPARAQMKAMSIGHGGTWVLSPLTYHAYDLGTFGGATSNAYAINNSGQVVGFADPYTGYYFGWMFHAFRHSGTGSLNAATDDLGTFGGACSVAYGINTQGTVVGTAQDNNENFEVFHHVGAGALNPTNVNRYSSMAYDDFGDLGDGAGVPNDGFGVASCINDSDTFVGYSNFAQPMYAFAHQSGQGSLFNRLLYMLAPEFGNSDAYGVNSQGCVVGDCQMSGSAYHAIFIPGGTLSFHGDMSTLGSGRNSCATAINSANVAVGWSQIVSDEDYRHAFRHLPPSQYVGSGVGLLTSKDDLGTLYGGANSEAHAINVNNLVVGKSDWLGSGSHAFFYDSGMHDLNSYLDAASAGWTLTEANGVNDSGTIVGQGLINGQLHAFVAVPNPRYYYYVP